MGRYRVFYFEDLREGEVLIGCPVCEEIERNFIEPVAVILEKDDFSDEVKKQLEKIKSLEELKEDTELFKKILNKDDLVCILHQNKKGKHWEEDTEEFGKWNEEVDIKNLTSNIENLINQFWRRVRAYRFAVDYKDLWEEAGQNWESFEEKLKGKIDLEELKKDKDKKENLNLKLYLKKENWIRKSNIYDFRQIKFPLFFNYASLIEKENETWKAKINLNFWYKNEILAFQNEADFSDAIFQNVAYFNEATFQNEAYFNWVIFQNGANFSDAIFQNVAYFSRAILQNEMDFNEATFRDMANFSGAIFQNGIDFSKTTFQNVAYFNEATFRDMANFSGAIFQNGVDFSKTTFQNVAYFSWAKFEKEVYFRGCIIAKFVLDNINLHKGTYFEINNCNFIALKFANFVNHTDNFFVLNSRINKEIGTKLNNSEVKLEIDNCVLNDTKFLNCNFSQAERITIKNSFIEDVAFNNVDWGEISEKRISPILFEKNPKSARDTYRQIKHALDKHSDHINANWFYALEMKAYEKYLKTLSWKDHFQEKLVFSIHKFISEFGISWVRPLVLIVLSTIIMLGFGIKLFPIEEIENEASTTIFGFVVDKFYYVAPLWNIDFWVIYIALATIGIYFYIFYIIWKTDEVKLEKKEIGYEDAGFTFKTFNINSYKMLVSLFFTALAVYIIGLFWLYSGNSLITAVFEFLDRFATTLNIFKVSSHFVGEDSSLHKLYSGYLFLYKIYAIFILVLIYQLILAIRRRVRR